MDINNKVNSKTKFAKTERESTDDVLVRPDHMQRMIIFKTFLTQQQIATEVDFFSII